MDLDREKITQCGIKCDPHSSVSSWRKTNFCREGTTISRAPKQKLHHATPTQSFCCFSYFIMMYTRTSLLLAPLQKLLCKTLQELRYFCQLHRQFFLGCKQENMAKGCSYENMTGQSFCVHSEF